MKLHSAAGNTFELVVLRYEHPDVTADRWDANWLVVSGKVTTNGESWRFVDACVTTFELAELSDWLHSLGGDGVAAGCGFAEPNLEFAYIDASPPLLRVRFACESAPPWLSGPDDRRSGIWLEFDGSEVSRASAVAELRNALIEFPIRGGAA